MAKRTGRKPEPKNLAELRKANPELNEADLSVAAKLRLDQKLIKMFGKQAKDLDHLADLQEKVKLLQAEKEKFDDQVRSEVTAWLGENHPFSSLYGSDLYLDGLKQIAKGKKNTVAAGGKRKTWDAAACLEALKGVKTDGEGWADGREVFQSLKLIGMDQAAKRLKLETGELKASSSGEEEKEVKVAKDYTWKKKPNTRSTYKVNIVTVRERLSGRS